MPGLELPLSSARLLGPSLDFHPLEKKRDILKVIFELKCIGLIRVLSKSSLACFLRQGLRQLPARGPAGAVLPSSCCWAQPALPFI